METLTNFFLLFGLPVSFRVDEKLLKKSYYQLSREYHPDFYASASEEERQLTEIMSERVNQGFSVLSNALSRIEYVLVLRGLVSENEKFQLPQDFLMEMMELNERIESFGDQQSGPEWEVLLDEIHQFENLMNEKIESCATQYDFADDKMSILNEMKTIYFKYKYLLRIRENLSTFAPPL